MRLNIKLNPSVVPAELSQLAKLKILDLTKMNLCEHLPWDAICMLTKLEGIRCASRCMRLRVAFSLSFCVLILRVHCACSFCLLVCTDIVASISLRIFDTTHHDTHTPRHTHTVVALQPLF
jgi:hypothetical protein